ncbi:MAG TPA: hypothetical protein PLD93_01625, partial [Synergistaceae bacterium]|nr:hypothetical protein [Synergistaceae bacterium]
KVSPQVRDVLISEGIQTGVTLTVRVWGTDINGKQRSGVIGQITPGKDSVAPGAPTSLTASSGFGEVVLNWVPPITNEDGSPCTDLAYCEIWECATDDRGSAVCVGKVNGSYFARYLGTFESRYYWVRAVDTSGNVSQWNAEPGVLGFADMENIEALFDWLLENDPLFAETYEDLHTAMEDVEALEVDLAASKVTLQENQYALQESLTDALNQLAVGVGNLVQDSDETKSIFRDAEITVDPETGEVRIGAVELLRTETGAQFSEVEETLSAQEASINLKASRTYVDELATALISGVETAEKWETLSAWTPANATISGTTFDPTGTGSTLTSPVIAVDGEENPIFSIHVQQTAGTGWGAKLQWKTSGHDYSSSYEKTITAPSGDLSTGVWIQMDMSESSDWEASEIIGLRILLGESAADEFVIDHISVGKSALQALILSGLEARVTQAEIDIDGAEAAIILKANQTTVDALGARMDQAEIDIDAAEAAIDLKASTTALNETTARVTTAETRIDAMEGEISSEIIATLANTVAEGVAENILESEREIAALATAEETLSAEIVSESEASASQRLLLQAAIDNAQAAILEESSARVTGDEVVASSVETLSAAIGDPDDPDEGTVYAAIQNEQTARVSGDSAIASSVSTLTSTVNGHTSSISVNASAINGIKAKYAVKVNSAGRISGFELISGEGDSAFAVSADSFYIYSPSTGNKNVFYYDSTTGSLRLRYLVVDGALIKDLSVERIHIKHSQFVTMEHYRSASRITFSAIGQTATAAFKSITVESGYPVTIIFNAMTKVLEGRWNLYLYRDSTCIASVTDWAFGSLQTGATYSFLDQSASGGSHTYYVKIYLYGADPSAIAGNWFWERNLILLHGKR